MTHILQINTGVCRAAQDHALATAGIGVIQINLNHCWAAQQLLLQTMAERGAAIAVISDYNRPMGDAEHWVASSDRKCAIFVPGASDAVIIDQGGGVGFAWARFRQVTVYSCYSSPNCTVQEFDLFLGGLEESIRLLPGVPTNLVVAGDFNSHSMEWGSTMIDARGRLLSDLVSALGFTVSNVGTRPTYRRVNAASVIDVTFERALPHNRPLISNWEVLEDVFSASDHLYVVYNVLAPVTHAILHQSAGVRQPGWSVKKLNPDAVNVFWELIGPSRQLSERAPAREHVERLNDFLSASCDAAMPCRTKMGRKRAVHWWSDSIAELRKIAIAARRIYQRAGRRLRQSDRDAEFEAYRNARKDLKNAIRKAQERSWTELCRAVDGDPWGVPYRLVTKRLGHRSPAMDQMSVVSVARDLFPLSPPFDWNCVSMTAEDIEVFMETDDSSEVPLFTPEEVARAVRKLPSGKAPGPDLVPNELIRLAHKRFPAVFNQCYNACLVEGHFPLCWKRAKLVLLHKGQGKPRDVSSSYRPLSLLDGAGKVLERLLLDRLNNHIETVGALCNLQFGFRRARSTTDAIDEVLKTARAAGEGPVQKRDLCVLISLDVKNAFNSAPWRLIDSALRRYAAPTYLVKILRSYMQGRELLINDEVSMPVTCGVPQGSVLGPTLWNIFYDGVLRLPVRQGVKLVAFADDVAVIAVAHNAELIEELVNHTLNEIAEWMKENGLKLAPEKSECVVLTKKYAYRDPELFIEGCLVPVRRSIRYLGVYLDTRLSFGVHVAKVTAGARKAATVLGRLMPNVGGPMQCKRSLLMSVIHSRILYGAPLWADEVQKIQKYKNLLLQTQRCAALRVARCYRTVSDMAALVLARMPPATLVATGRKRVAAAKKIGIGISKADVNTDVIRQWQELWVSTTSKAAWTKRLIPDLTRWWNQGPTEVSFHMAQVLTGHGCFQSYLWKKRRAISPACPHCSEVTDDAEHTVFSCPFWDAERSELTTAVGRFVVPEDVIYLLCGPVSDELPDDPVQKRRLLAAAKKHGDMFKLMVESIMTQKEEQERQRQRPA